jgi:hypothetical protein
VQPGCADAQNGSDRWNEMTGVNIFHSAAPCASARLCYKPFICALISRDGTPSADELLQGGLIAMKHLQHCSCLCLIGGVLLTGAVSCADADQWNKKTYVTISQSIEVPGAVLPPGKYVFKLLDSQSDRHIVQILNDRENHVYSTNLAVPKERTEPAGKTIITFYEMPGGGAETVRAWFYPGDQIGQEFVYPAKRMAEIRAAMRGDAVTLAENRAPQPARVTSAETPSEPASEATAEATAPPPAPAPEVSETQPPEEQRPAEQPATAPASNPTPAEIPAQEPAMPHTGGNSVGFGLLGLMCGSLAASLRIVNRLQASRL